MIDEQRKQAFLDGLNVLMREHGIGIVLKDVNGQEFDPESTSLRWLALHELSENHRGSIQQEIVMPNAVTGEPERDLISWRS